MEKKSEIRVVFDKIGNTLDVWFTEPRKAICEETEEEFIIKKDIDTGEIIGFERFNVFAEGGSIPELKFSVKESSMPNKQQVVKRKSLYTQTKTI